jgi:hypothetical protein
MAGAGFHSIAKLRARIRNAVLADHGVFQADCHREKLPYRGLLYSEDRI